MKATGFIKKIDETGRIVIPKSVRKALDVEIGDDLQFFLEDGAVVLKKFSNGCVFCGATTDLKELNEKHICCECIKKLG